MHLSEIWLIYHRGCGYKQLSKKSYCNWGKLKKKRNNVGIDVLNLTVTMMRVIHALIYMDKLFPLTTIYYICAHFTDARESKRLGQS